MTLNKFYGNGRERTGPDWKSSHAGWQSLSNRQVIWLDLLDFLLRRLLIKFVCYFPEFVSFKTFRETSFERIWAKLYCFGSTFWHPFGEKLGPFWGVGSRPHFGSLLELFFWIFGAPGPPRRNPFGSLFGSCCHPEAPWGWKFRILGGLVAESFFKEILHHFWRGPGQWKRWFRMGGVAKITISPKSEFYHFLSPFRGSFWSQNLSKMALGLAMGRPG